MSFSLQKLEYVCLVGSIALIGADRIDLFAGHGPFRLTPFLVLAPVVILIHLMAIGWNERSHVNLFLASRPFVPFISVLLVFLFLSYASTIFGIDPERGLFVLTNLSLISTLGAYIAIRVLVEPERERLIFRAVRLGLILYLVFCVGECAAWVYGFDSQGGSPIQSMFAPEATVLWIPRLSGFTLDANRGGFVLVMFLALLDWFATNRFRTRFLRFTIGFFVFLTLSRSAILCWLVYYLFSGMFWKRSAIWKMTLWLALTSASFAFVFVIYRQNINDLIEDWNVAEMVSERVSGEEGTSGGNHIRLIQRGLDTWLSSARTVTIGIGFGSSPKVLGDFFGDDKYGNFHCLYVTVLAELGLMAFLVLLILLGYPCVGKKSTAPCLAAMLIFNVPYESHMEPIFWVALALAWSFEPRTWKLVLPQAYSLPTQGATIERS